MTMSIVTVLPLVQAAPERTFVVAPGGVWAIALAVAMVVLALAAVAIFFLLLRVALELRSLDRRVQKVVVRAQDRLDPVMERARVVVAENAEYISHALRADVEKLGAATEAVRRSLDEASRRMDERIDELNALIEVVQSEAEELFLDTASAMRGVKAGTRSLRDRAGRDREDAGSPPETETPGVDPGTPSAAPLEAASESAEAPHGRGGRED